MPQARPGSNVPVAPAALWQELRAIAELHREDQLGAIKAIAKCGPDDDARFAVVAGWPDADTTVTVPTRKKGKTKEVNGLDIYFDHNTPLGVEWSSRIKFLTGKKTRTSDDETELATLRSDRRNTLRVMGRARAIGDMRAKLMSRGFGVTIVYNRLALKPIVVTEPAPKNGVPLQAFMSIPSFVGLYPEGLAPGQTSLAALTELERPAEQGADGDRNDDKDGKAHFTKLKEVVNALSGVGGFLDDEGRMKHIRAVKVTEDTYAHMRHVFFLLGDALANKAKAVGEVHATLHNLKALIPPPTVKAVSAATKEQAPTEAPAQAAVNG